MRTRAFLGACVTAAVIATAVPLRAQPLAASQAAAASQRPTSATDVTDDDLTIRAFLDKLQVIVQASDADAFASLEGPLGSKDDAAAFARAEFTRGATRVVIQERDRSELSLNGIPGIVYALTVDAFIEVGNQARVATWQLFLRKSGDSWAMIRQQLVSAVDNLFRLTLNTTKQFDAHNLVISAEDLQLTLVEGAVFTIDTDQGVTGLVVFGRGEMRFSPAPDTEKGQVRIFTGSSEVLESRFDGAFLRVGIAAAHYDQSQLVPRAAVDPRDLKRAQQIFKEESPKSFTVDLADLTRDAWTLLPGPDDFLSEVRTRRFNTLTYARSASEPEDISVFERRRKRNIAMYASKEKLATRGRFYNEDDLAPFDVLDYDLDVTALPDRQWVEGRARMRIRVRAPSLGQLTIRLADTLTVRSVVSDKFGRMFNLRVSNQNTILVNLPTILAENAELTLTILYGGRLEPQSPDRETLFLQDEPAQANGAVPQFPEDLAIPKAEPSFLYSNRSYWYPQSTISDYATAKIRLTVPVVYGCVASGEPAGPPEVVGGRDGTDARHVYVFNARRPARYLSFIVSRFISADQSLVSFADAPAQQPADDAQGSAEALPDLKLDVEANPRQTRQGKALIGRAADIMRYYQSLVGDSPYPSFTIALVENVLPGGHSPAYFAQLNQPLPNSPLVWRNDPAAFENFPEFFMAHEIAHQWWGHGVGWQNYHDQWLSEGFAQYFATLYANKFRGDEVFQGVLKKMRRWALNESDQGPVHLGYRVGHIKNDGRAFRAVIYNKAAMVLHMLRLMLGDDVFFNGVRRFYLSSRFRKVGSEDFRLAMQEESGRDLQRFFERWIYNASLPQITFSSRVEAGTTGPVAVLRFEQTTPEIFDLPAVITLLYADGRSTDITAVINDRVVEVRQPLDGALKSASISKRDVALVEFKDAPSAGK